MKKNYLVYPVKNMNITQTYSGKTSHYNNTVGSPWDYPFDEAGKNSAREYMYCPCDEMILKRIYGVGNSGTNTIWLQSTKKVVFADGTSDYFTLMVIHPNDSDLKKLKVGQIFKRGEKICREGTDGISTGNHFHFSGGKGKMKGNGWAQNTKGKWVLYVTGETKEPEKLFFIDTKFTKVIKNGGISFKKLPKEKEDEKAKRATVSQTYIVTTSLLNVRKGPSVNDDILSFSELTASAQEQIVRLSGKKRDGYVKGVEFTAKEIKGEWAKTPSGWVNLKYCEKKE